MRICIAIVLWGAGLWAMGQGNKDWQQHVDYAMEIDFDHRTHQFKGSQKLVYTNNSPETLDRVYYHLYFNAFQPKSMMDVRQRTLPDPDSRIGERILNLKPEEIGYHKILKLTQDGKAVSYEIRETILIVELDHPIKAGKKSVFEMEFESQVPVQIRRCGRNSREGIDYSMTQWYPKMAEYDYEGWHADPYIAREFHGVWGDFDVTISMDSAFTIAATGGLQRPERIGKGYADLHPKYEGQDRLQWRFKAKNVHDFAWAADRDYAHDIHRTQNGTDFHFFYEKGDEQMTENWKNLPKYAEQCADIMDRDFGTYPYDHYSVVQGGDGGMEYPMLTLISGEISLPGLISVTVHEFIHSWYQGLLGSNEQMYPWLDEGFTQYVQTRVLAEMRGRSLDLATKGSYASYRSYANSEFHEPMSLFSDYYATNKAYGANAYTKGGIFLHQLTYIIGEDAFLRGMRRYYEEWRFLHPEPRDFMHIMEQESGIQLDWYFNHWLQSTHNIDYAIGTVTAEDNNTKVVLERRDRVPMPIELKLVMADGSEQWFYIPLLIMWGEKEAESELHDWNEVDPWPWVYPEYVLHIPVKMENIRSMEIDPSCRMADIDLRNNVWPVEEDRSIQIEVEWVE
jgi:hypothetical protein